MAFWGFGGVQVSEAEKATLTEISSALGASTGSTPGATAERTEQAKTDLAAASAPGDRVPGEDQAAALGRSHHERRARQR